MGTIISSPSHQADAFLWRQKPPLVLWHSTLALERLTSQSRSRSRQQHKEGLSVAHMGGACVQPLQSVSVEES